MAYATSADILERMSTAELIDVADDENTNEDRRELTVTKFQCDTADTSGHFEDASSVAVKVGLTQTAQRIVVGVFFLVGTVWYEITAITSDGSGNDGVAFSGTLAEATYDLEIEGSLKSAEVDGRVERAIEDAEAEIDKELSCDYTVPLTGTIPDLIRKYTVDVAQWNLYTRRPQSFSRDDNDTRRLRYENVLAGLEKICDSGQDIGSNKPRNSKITPQLEKFDEFYEGSTESEGYTSRGTSRVKLNGF